MKGTVFRDVMQCSLVEAYRNIGVNFCLHLWGLEAEQLSNQQEPFSCLSSCGSHLPDYTWSRPRIVNFFFLTVISPTFDGHDKKANNRYQKKIQNSCYVTTRCGNWRGCYWAYIQPWRWRHYVSPKWSVNFLETTRCHTQYNIVLFKIKYVHKYSLDVANRALIPPAYRMASEQDNLMLLLISPTFCAWLPWVPIVLQWVGSWL
jgi:hypothetical protein